MGYQESYIWSSKKNFNKLLQSFVDGEKYWTQPVEVLTFIKDHKPFKKGQKVVYVTGERYPQSHWKKMLIPDFQHPSYILFTEEVEAKGIWPDAGEVTDVIHEDFPRKNKPF